MKTLLLFLLAGISLTTGGGLTVKVSIKGFENNKGKAFVAIYDAKEKMIKGVAESVVNQQVTINFTDLPSGKYAVKVFHDENNNGKMDTGMFGIPKEKYGFSNNVKVVMSAPKIEELLFDVSSDKTITINLK
jgi:uncharacterized protein (DUF2141 family)